MGRKVDLKAFDTVDKLVSQGVGVYKACEQAGTTVGTYRRVKGMPLTNRESKRTSEKLPEKYKRTIRPKLLTLPALEPSAGKMFMLYGTPTDLAKAMRELQ